MAGLLGATWAVAACSAPLPVGPLEHPPVLDTLGIPPLDQTTLTPVFSSGFEHDSDFAGFYVTPQSAMTRHEVRSGDAHTGNRAHVAWLTGQTGPEPVDGPNHRGYPTIQLPRRPVGTCTTPCLIEFWARLDDVNLKPGEWFSLATFSADPSDRWARVVTVNVGWQGWLYLFHVPDQGIGEWVAAAHRHSLPAGPMGAHHDMAGPRPRPRCGGGVAGRRARVGGARPRR